MTAIQRWVIYGVTGVYKPDPDEADVQQWCRAKDVAELERLLAEQSAKHEAVVKGLRKQIDTLESHVSALEDELLIAGQY